MRKIKVTFYFLIFYFLFFLQNLHAVPEQLSLLSEMNHQTVEVKDYLKWKKYFNQENELVIIAQKLSPSQISANEFDQINNLLKLIIPPEVLRNNFLPTSVQIPLEKNNKMYWIDLLNTRDGKAKFLSMNEQYLRIPILVNNDQESKTLLRNIKKLDHQKDFKFHVLGVSPFRVHIQDAVKYYLFYLFPLLVLILVFLMAWYFKSWVPAFITFGVLGLATTLTFLTSLLFYQGFSTFSSIGLLFVFVAGTSDLIHLFHQFSSMKNIQMKNIDLAFKSIFKPCFYTSLTTGIGFSSLMLSDLKTVMALGLSCLIGITLCFIITFYLLPSMIKLMFKINPEILNWNINPIFQFKNLYLKNSNWVTLIYIILVLISLLGINYLTLEDNFYQKFNDQHPFSRSAQIHIGQFGNLDRFDLIFHTDLKSKENWPLFLAEISKLPQIKKIISLDTINQNFNQFVSNQKLKDKFNNQLLHSAIGKQMIQNDMEKISLILTNIDDDQLIVLHKKIKQISKKFFPKDSITNHSFSYLRAIFFKQLTQQLSSSIGFSVLTILIIFIFLYRQTKMVFIAMFVNLIPIVTTLGLFILMEIKGNMNLAIIVTMLLGLAVDDTIHYLHYVYQSNSQTIQTPKVIISAPIIFTSLVLIIGFAIIGFGPIRIFSEISFFMCFGLLFALIADIFVLPYLLQKLRV